MSGAVLQRPIQFGRQGHTITDNEYFDSVNRSIDALIPSGPYANDAAAATAGIPKMGTYYDATGVVHVRLT